ncbi:MAG: endonuclease [Patescibacteria group bacterium]|nr:endonuclease [Patescibacteria group bacterium]
MEGPSLHLAAEQLKPFKGKSVLIVMGNTKIGKERLAGKKVKDIFAWGKHLVFQFDDFAIRIHFMLFGTFEAQVNGVWVTGDYRKAREPRLSLTFENGVMNAYNCSVKFIESAGAKKEYNFSVDIMSPKWDHKRALAQMQANAREEISDVLLDQEIFAGVGNIIKNEVLSLTYLNPRTRVENIPKKKLTEIIKETRKFSKQFLAWRRKFVLKKNLKAHRKSACPHCGTKLIREKTGRRERWAYWCPVCQVLPSTKRGREKGKQP